MSGKLDLVDRPGHHMSMITEEFDHVAALAIDGYRVEADDRKA